MTQPHDGLLCCPCGSPGKNKKKLRIQSGAEKQEPISRRYCTVLYLRKPVIRKERALTIQTEPMGNQLGIIDVQENIAIFGRSADV